jgi:regulator of sigma E protease
MAPASVLPGAGAVGIGEEDPEGTGTLDPEVVRRAYCNQPPWKRIVVILAGPGMNLLIAFLIFWAILVSGSLNGDLTLGDLNPSIKTLVPTTSVLAIERGKPADGVLRPGDRILAVDGRPVTVTSAQRAMAAHRCAGGLTEGCRAAAPVQLTVRRAGRTLILSVYPRYSRGAGKMLIGFEFGAAPKRFGAFAAAGVAVHEMWTTTGSLLTGIGRAFTSAKARKEVHTIVGIGEIAHEAVSAGAGYGLVILGFISLVLAVVNLFPFLPLDGGHVVWALAEKLRGGRRVPVAVMWRYSSVGMLLFLFLFINGLSNDISRLGG